MVQEDVADKVIGMVAGAAQDCGWAIRATPPPMSAR